MEIKKIKTSEIKPYINNARINDRTVELLAKAIEKYGYNQPIVVDKNNVIVKGHARYKALIRLGYEEIECIISENSDELNNQDRLKDNLIAEETEWDLQELKYELEITDIELEDFKTTIEAMNVEVEEKKSTRHLDRIVDVKKNQGKRDVITITCPHCGEEVELEL